VNRRARLLFVAVIGVVGCSGDESATRPANSAAPFASIVPNDSSLASSGVTATPATTATTCDAPTPIVQNEVQGISADASIYGLLLLNHQPPIHAGDEVKIAWRMTGTGELSVASTSPSAEPGVLTFGPEAHAGSSYERPGDEWGTGFMFGEPGCWQVHLERTSGVSGDVWFNVAAA